MTTLTITAKGQITLKKELLKHLNAIPGQRIVADQLPDGRLLVRAATQNGSIDKFIGSLEQKSGARLSIAQIKRIAADGWAGKR
jgi:bifunctional DNA-binding transcriptional regulator/antitoxin component of YhaV-PrlF toxin-antitoxin module